MEKCSEFRPVIMGAATGYSPDKVELFLNSISRTNYTGVVTLFLNGSQVTEYKDFFKNRTNYKFSLEFVDSKIGTFSSSKSISKNFKKCIRFLSKFIVSSEPKLKKDFIYFLAPPHVSRFFDYYDYLQRNNFSHVVLTDTRDVIVQGDLNELNQNGLFLGMEDKSLLLGKDSFHIKWISDVYGKNYLKEIADKQISCAGVTFGDYQSMSNYLDVMINEFMSLPYYTMVRSNYDQGIHNKLLYSDAFSALHLCQPLESKIATLGVMNVDKINLNEDAILLNLDGTTPLFVHQYDRHEELENIFTAKYL